MKLYSNSKYKLSLRVEDLPAAACSVLILLALFVTFTHMSSISWAVTSSKLRPPISVKEFFKRWSCGLRRAGVDVGVLPGDVSLNKQDKVVVCLIELFHKKKEENIPHSKDTLIKWKWTLVLYIFSLCMNTFASYTCDIHFIYCQHIFVFFKDVLVPNYLFFNTHQPIGMYIIGIKCTCDSETIKQNLYVIT